jgi:hypothetical protein
MSQYLKISNVVAGSVNSGLKQSIEYIGKHYGKLANKKGYDNNAYFKYGVKFIAKQFGRFRKNAIRYMVYPKNIKDSERCKQWCFNKQTYSQAFGYIIDKLLLCPTQDSEYVATLLNKLYETICNNSGSGGSPIERKCSNALIYWQKVMLSQEMIDNSIYQGDRKSAERILGGISEVDKPLPPRYNHNTGEV